MAKMLVWWFLMFIFCDLTLTADANSELPTSVIPTHYNVTFLLRHNYVQTNSFDGETIIFLTVNETTSSITLHSSSLQVSVVKVLKSGCELHYKDLEYRSKTKQLIINMEKPLEVGSDYQLYIKYKGLLESEGTGLVISFTSEAGHVVKTEFQPNVAHRAFPCFDQSHFITDFNLTLIYPNHLKAFGRTSSSFTTLKHNIIESFSKISEIPADSLYFQISDFIGVEENILVEDWPKVDDAQILRDVAHEISTLVTQRIEEFTGISREKIKRKENFNMNNTEKTEKYNNNAFPNHGLIQLHDYYMFDNDDHNAIDERKMTLEAIDDSVNYWFDNLITNANAEDDWLHRALKTHFICLILNTMYPELQLSKQLIIKVQRRLLRNDGRISPDPMSPQEQQQQSENRYFKGVSVLHMMHTLNRTLHDQIKNYLHNILIGEFSSSYGAFKRQIKSVTSHDITFDKVMDNWMAREGYPLVKVMKISRKKIKLTQKRFLYISTNVSVTDSADWYIPLSYTLEDKAFNLSYEDPENWLTPRISKLSLAPPNLKKNWIIFNDPAFGYYRIYYEYHLMDRVYKTLETDKNKIPDLVRAQLVDDGFNIAITKELSYTKAFGLLGYLVNETDYFVWYTAFENFKILLERIQAPNVKDALIAKILVLMEKVYRSVSLASTNFNDPIYTLKQVMVHEWACKLKHTECVHYANRLFRNYMYSPRTRRPAAYFRSFIYCTGLQRNTEIERESKFLWDEFHNSQSFAEQQTILIALGCTTNETALNIYFDKTMNLEIDKQVLINVFQSVISRTPEGANITYNYFKRNYIDIVHYFEGSNLLQNMFRIVVNSLKTQQEFDELQHLSKNEIEDGLVKRAIARSHANAKLNNKITVLLASYFEKQNG